MKVLPLGIRADGIVRARKGKQFVSLVVRKETAVEMARTLGLAWWSFNAKTESYERCE